MIAPSIAAGWLLSFTLSLDDLVLASFVSGPGATTLPMEVFSAVRLGVKPEINAIASVILLAVALFTLLAWFLVRSADKRSRMPPPEDDKHITWQAAINSRKHS
jgi:putrescine transport system permease protein